MTSFQFSDALGFQFVSTGDWELQSFMPGVPQVSHDHPCLIYCWSYSFKGVSPSFFTTLITLALLSLICWFLQHLHFCLIFLFPSMLGFKHWSIPCLSWVFIFSHVVLPWRISVLSLAYIATSTLTIYKYIAATQPFHPTIQSTCTKLCIQHLHVESPLVSQV